MMNYFVPKSCLYTRYLLSRNRTKEYPLIKSPHVLSQVVLLEAGNDLLSHARYTRGWFRSVLSSTAFFAKFWSM